MNKREIELSKFISKILRHNPEIINIKMNKNGTILTKTLIDNINEFSNFNIKLEDLIKIVNDDDKKRYSFIGDNYLYVRANQGHSISGINPDLKIMIPPKYLYHGTSVKNLNNIMRSGIKRGQRNHVHLSDDIPTAIDVGNRRKGSETIILKINTENMVKDKYKFYISTNGIWLIDHIPSQYIEEKIKGGN